jgi:TonB family protein
MRFATRMAAGLVLLLCVCRTAAAQDPAMYDLAKQMAEALVKAKQTNVVVVDFVWVDGKGIGARDVSALGERLGNDFRAALMRQSLKLSVESRAKTLERLQKKQLVMANLRAPQTAEYLFGGTLLTAWIGGEMSSGVDGLKITITAHPLGKRSVSFSTEASIPLTEELKALIRDPAPDEFAALAKAGQNGVSYPACLYCPQADYTAEAQRQHLGGTVMLETTIDETGQPKDVRVKVGLPFGLTPQAVDAVEKWRFKPATDADGKAVAVRQTVDVTFRMY